jgi:PHD/YefM family antitoxin component YafN of YafNO toxin-antitoxin module
LSKLLYSEYILNYTYGMNALIYEVQSSELSRNPLKVFSAAEKNPVTVTRRDGEDLLLMAKARAEDSSEFMVHASRVMSALADEQGTIVERMMRQYPWIHPLDDRWRAVCVDDLIRTTISSVALNAPDAAMRKLSSWRETAYATSMGWGEEPKEWLEKPVRVKRPRRLIEKP